MKLLWMGRALERVSIILWMSVVLPAVGSPKYEFYSQSYYSSRYDNFIIDGKLNWMFPETLGVSPYIGISLSQDSLSDETFIYNENYQALQIGLRSKNFLSSYLFVEGRQLAVQSESKVIQDRSQQDLRSGGVHYHWLDLNWLSAYQTYLESYGEFFHSTRLNDLFLNVILRGGLTTNLSSQWTFGPYFAVQLKRDRSGFFYENSDEWRSGVRTAYQGISLYTMVFLTYGEGRYRPTTGQQPRSLNFEETRALIAIGGH